MRLSQAAKHADSFNRRKAFTVEQIKQMNLATDSYAVFVRQTVDGKDEVLQFDDDKQTAAFLRPPKGTASGR